MNLTLVLRQELSGKCLFNGRVINMGLGAQSAPNSLQMGEGAVMRTFAWKCLPKMKVRLISIRAYILMGSIYVMKYNILIATIDFCRKVSFTIKDPVQGQTDRD